MLPIFNISAGQQGKIKSKINMNENKISVSILRIKRQKAFKNNMNSFVSLFLALFKIGNFP